MRACLASGAGKADAGGAGNKQSRSLEDPAEALVADTASGEGTAFRPTQEVSVLDVFRDIATVRVRSERFVEYLRLARFEDRYLIVNAVYLVLV